MWILRGKLRGNKIIREFWMLRQRISRAGQSNSRGREENRTNGSNPRYFNREHTQSWILEYWGIDPLKWILGDDR